MSNTYDNVIFLPHLTACDTKLSTAPFNNKSKSLLAVSCLIIKTTKTSLYHLKKNLNNINALHA